jgi:hypothetical protein
VTRYMTQLWLSGAQKAPLIQERKSLKLVAEGEGFEPSMRRYPHNGLAIRLTRNENRATLGFAPHYDTQIARNSARTASLR